MSSFFQIKSPLSRGSHVDLDDSLRTKQTLRGLGFFKTPSYGLTPYPDEPLFEAIEGLQRRHGLKVDGVMKPGGETASAMKKVADEKTENGGDSPCRPGYIQMVEGICVPGTGVCFNRKKCRPVPAGGGFRG